jgi:hypothetical protein
MTYLLANDRNWSAQTDVILKPLGGLGDLLDGIKTGAADSFLWETFTTKPYCDQGLVRFVHEVAPVISFRKVDEVVTPWPCFVVAVRSELLSSQRPALKKLLSAIQESCSEFKKTSKSLKYISKESKLSLEDSKTWFDQVEFSYDGKISRKVLRDAVDVLSKIGVLKGAASVELNSLYDEQIANVSEE